MVKTTLILSSVLLLGGCSSSPEEEQDTYINALTDADMEVLEDGLTRVISGEERLGVVDHIEVLDYDASGDILHLEVQTETFMPEEMGLQRAYKYTEMLVESPAASATLTYDVELAYSGVDDAFNFSLTYDRQTDEYLMDDGTLIDPDDIVDILL